MRQRRLGMTGIEVSELGFGCAGFWAKPAFSDRQAIALVHRAIDLGVTFFDTSSHYGRGEAERRLGKALRSRSGGIVVATKAGSAAKPGWRIAQDFGPAAIRESLEESLRRLGVDHVDVLLLHLKSPADLSDDLVAGLVELRTKGFVRAAGVSGFGPALLERVMDVPVLEVVMADYNLLRARRAPWIARLASAGRGFLASRPLAQGHFARRPFVPRRTADAWYLARAYGRHRDEMRRGRALRFVDGYEGWTGAEAALAFVLADPNVASAVVGTTQPAHLDANAAATGRSLTPALRERIEEAQQAFANRPL